MRQHPLEKPESLWGRIFITLIAALCYGCATPPPPPDISTSNNRGGIPYEVRGVTYYPMQAVEKYEEEGVASWYGPGFHGKKTSNGETFDMNAATAAHKTLPFNTRIKVINLDNRKETEVRINDRGPFVGTRIIDLSFSAAKQLGMIHSGTARVRLVALQPVTGQARPAGYSVQLGVYREQENAEQAAQHTENSRIESYYINQARVYRVLVGREKTFPAALKLRDAARQNGFRGAFIVSVPQAETEPARASSTVSPEMTENETADSE